MCGLAYYTRVGIVGCGGHRTGGWGHPLLRTFPCRGRCPQRPVDNGCTPVVPLIRHGCAMPPSPLRGEGFGRSVGSAQMSMAFPSSVTANAVPPSPRGRLFVSYPRSRCRGGYDPPGIPPLGLPIPFVPSGHFPLTRGIGLAMTGFLTALAPPVGELARRQP